VALASERRPDLVLMDVRIKGAHDGATGGPEVRELLASATNWRLEKPLCTEQLRDVIRAALGQVGRCAREECA